MKPLPTWLQSDVWACHTPTTIVFQPKKCVQDGDRNWLLLDCNNQEYLLSECERFDPVTHLYEKAGLLVIGKESVPIRYHNCVLEIGSGRRRVGIRAGVARQQEDELVKSAKHLAHFFGGALFDYPDYETSNHYQEMK